MNSSTSTVVPWVTASSMAGSTSSCLWMMWTPTLEPSQGGLMTKGRGRDGITMPPEQSRISARGGGNPGFQKYLLGFGLVKAQGAGTGTGSRIRNAAFLQNGLKGPVLAEGAVNDVVGQFRAFRQPEVRTMYVHLRYVGKPGLAQGAVNGLSGDEGYFPFRSGAAKEKGNLEVALESAHVEIK